MAAATCPTCGAPAKALDEQGILYAIDETDVGGLAALFRGDFDQAKCETNGCPLPVRPTIGVLFHEPGTVLHMPGTLVKAEATSADRLEEYRRQGIAVEAFQSIDALRVGVAKRLSSRVPAVTGILIASSKRQLGEHVHQHWRELKPAVFAFGLLLLGVKIPGIRFGLLVEEGSATVPPAPTKSEILEVLAEAQARVWVTLCLSRLEWKPDHPPLEDDLAEFVDPEVILPGALDILFQMFDLIDREPTSLPLRFSVEAVRATLCSLANRPNPRAPEWAEVFFAQELACREKNVPAEIQSLTISEARARKTIRFQDAWDAAARRLNQVFEEARARRTVDLDNIRRLTGVLDEIATKAGHSNAVFRLLSDGLVIHDDASVEALIDLAKAGIDHSLGAEGILIAVRALAEPLVRQRRFDDLERLADSLLPCFGGDRKAQARVDAWLGSILNGARQPKRFLTRVGETASDNEFHLPPEVRISLWTERANALRLVGRVEDALEIAEELERLQAGDPDALRTARLNLAELRREAGAPDAAIEILTQLLSESTEGDRIFILHALANTSLQIGRFEEAASYARQALALTMGGKLKLAGEIRASVAQFLAAADHYDEAMRTLLENSTGESEGRRELGLLRRLRRYVDTVVRRFSLRHDDSRTQAKAVATEPAVLLLEASAWAMLLREGVSLPPPARERIAGIVGELARTISEVESAGDVTLHLGALRITAELSELLKTEDTEAWLRDVLAANRRYGQTPDLYELLNLAQFAYRRGQFDEGRNYLMQVPASLATQFGGTTDVATVVQGPARFRTTFRKLVGVLIEQGATSADIRLAADLAREAIGRAQVVRRRDMRKSAVDPLSLVPTDDALARLAPASGTFGVLEWVAGGDRLLCLLTCIRAGMVSSRWLGPPDVDITQGAERLRNRLANWRPGRSGDPFDLPAWRSCEEWLMTSLSPFLADGDHVVFIEHPAFAGLPWHVAAGRRWTSSYAACWSRLLELDPPAALRRPQSLGMVVVPRFKETAQVLDPMRMSANRTKAFAATHGVPLLTAEEHAADRRAFIRIMESSHVAKLLCHGFVSPADAEVALMLAREGVLPLADSIASAKEAGKAHWLSWRECQGLSAAPSVVFSAACSTGIVHSAGLGEQLGLFNALHPAGTRSMIAPRWDVVAASVIPILDEIVERYITEGGSLANVLRTACVAAESDQPRWLAWALALEGEWR